MRMIQNDTQKTVNPTDVYFIHIYNIYKIVFQFVSSLRLGEYQTLIRYKLKKKFVAKHISLYQL